MLKQYQQVVDDTIGYYNTVSSRTLKQILRSRGYRDFVRDYTPKQHMVSRMIMDKIAQRKPFTSSIKIKRLPTEQDLEKYHEFYG